jgi:transcription elongation factor SPT6
LGGDDEVEDEEEQPKPEMRYQDVSLIFTITRKHYLIPVQVFEPSEIKARHLTEDDDLIRAQDIPERMQLATSSLSTEAAISIHKPLTEADLGGAAQWVTTRISARKTREFFSPDGPQALLRDQLVLAVTYALRYLFIQESEVPYIWTHRRDYLSHFNPEDIRSRTELLNLSELWRIYTLRQKYRSLLERQTALDDSYLRLNVVDEYFESDICQQIDGVEVVADATEWLTMKYKDKKRNLSEFHFHDDEEQPEVKRRKMPSRISAYEIVKKSVVSRLA